MEPIRVRSFLWSPSESVYVEYFQILGHIFLLQESQEIDFSALLQVTYMPHLYL